VGRFVDYALGMQRSLGDRLASITTHNEPWVIAVLGHENGTFAPGQRSRRVALQVAHHLLLSHGLAVQAMRAQRADTQLGIVLNLSPMEAASPREEDRQAAQLADSLGRCWYADPLFKGAYPQQGWEALGDDVPQVLPGDMANIAVPIDFLGVNYYTRQVVGAAGHVDPRTLDLPLTDMDWAVYPKGLTDLLCLLHRDYRLPRVLITENGAAFRDELVAGQVQDTDRVEYLRTHIAAVADAMDQGVPMAGYMVWSLMDNFEWSSGYAKRFGIVHVDYATQRRTPKASALWYRAFLERCRAAQAAETGA
jgi:beta-glucosidase